jgi:hypothetical protein
MWYGGGWRGRNSAIEIPLIVGRKCVFGVTGGSWAPALLGEIEELAHAAEFFVAVVD